MYEVLDTLKSILRFANVIQFGLLFVWITSWYILYQMTRLGFLKLLIVGDVFYAVAYVLNYSEYFIGHTTQTGTLIIVFTLRVLRILATGFIATGACIGLRYLQKRWKYVDEAQNQKE